MHLITPALKDYAWGTSDDIPGLLGLPPSDSPVAEAWWGGHPDAPSIASVAGASVALDALIEKAPAACLGAEAAARWNSRLPYLLKVLAIASPLSIQVHPTLDQARDGFALERQHGGDGPVAFHDASHKPEMVVALTPMTVLAGVRPLVELRADLTVLGTAGSARLSAAIEDDISDFIALALAGGDDAETLAALATCGRHAPEGSPLRVSADALAHFPGDPGALVALALNVVRLQPGEAVYTGAGILHSYQSGVGIEVMANSDNVVRAGLTPKHVDVPLLLSLSSTTPAPAVRVPVAPQGPVATYETESDEFALTVVSDGEAEIPAGPRIALTIEGEAHVRCAGEPLILSRGRALFASHSEGPMRVVARGMTVVAHLPVRSPSRATAVS